MTQDRRQAGQVNHVCEYCASKGERGIKAGGDCIVCGVGRYKPEAPRIVAECWTCKAWGVRHTYWRDPLDSEYRSERENFCIAAGHDVREVGK